jgi:hypothetical protein
MGTRLQAKLRHHAAWARQLAHLGAGIGIGIGGMSAFAAFAAQPGTLRLTTLAAIGQSWGAARSAPTKIAVFGARPETVVDVVKHRAELAKQHDELLARQRSEPIDDQWAPGVAQSIRVSLQKAVQGSPTRIVDVQCATTLCAATAEWKNYIEAQQRYADVLHAKPELNCSVEILLPEPADPRKPYRATAIFDCAATRAALVAGHRQTP